MARLQPLKITYSPGRSFDLAGKCRQYISTATAALRVREETPKAKGWKNPKENQGEKGLCKHREANPFRGENPKFKSWSSRMGVGHRAGNPIPEK